MEQAAKNISTKRKLMEWELYPVLFSKWQRLFHWERFHYLAKMLIPFLKLTGLYAKGIANAENPVLETVEFKSKTLPAAFDGYRILFITDLHIEKNIRAVKNAIPLISSTVVDLILLGGDYRFGLNGRPEIIYKNLSKLLSVAHSTDGVFAVLGNHDSWEMVPDLERCGLHVLINNSVVLTRNGKSMYLAGIDDAHYFRTHNLPMAFSKIPKTGFSILLSHSNDCLTSRMDNAPQLVLCGHTHGGQIKMPLIGAPLVHSKLPKSCASGLWTFNGFTGYTSRGLGTSGLPVRYNCPPEITLLTLRTTN